MTQAEKIKEVGMVAAIISDAITKELYEEFQKRGTGYMSTVEKISDWAIEFVEKHKKTNWEDVLENETLKPLSTEMKSIGCWDDAVFDWAHYKLTEFSKS